MLKRLSLAFAGLFALTTGAFASGTIPFSLSQQFDSLGKPLTGGLLYLIQAGTTSTPQNCYQDSALTIAWPNPITLDSAGRIGQLFCADGTIKVRLTDKNGVTQVVADNIQVIGASSGSGGGGTVDATTILATGDLKVKYGTGTLTGFVRANGRTIGSATSGATERANADTQSLFEYLWGADANLTVSGGRGASANADWTANKTITLPDWRGRAIAGLDDMGASAASRLTSTYFGTSTTALGAASTTTDHQTIANTNLPPYTPTGSNSTSSASVSGNNIVVASSAVSSSTFGSGGFGFVPLTSGSFSSVPAITVPAQTFTGTAASGRNSTPFSTVPPTMLATIYLKL